MKTNVSSTHGWEDNVEMEQTGWDDMEWIHLAKNRHQCRAVLNMVQKNLLVP
jgi:hypothetical protein